MTKTLVIGRRRRVGGGSQNGDVSGRFRRRLLASRRVAKCDDIAQSVPSASARKSKRRNWMPMIRKKQSI